jgi:hypothetical protein
MIMLKRRDIGPEPNGNLRTDCPSPACSPMSINNCERLYRSQILLRSPEREASQIYFF